MDRLGGWETRWLEIRERSGLGRELKIRPWLNIGCCSAGSSPSSSDALQPRGKRLDSKDSSQGTAGAAEIYIRRSTITFLFNASDKRLVGPAPRKLLYRETAAIEGKWVGLITLFVRNATVVVRT